MNNFFAGNFLSYAKIHHLLFISAMDEPQEISKIEMPNGEITLSYTLFKPVLRQT